MNTEARVSFPEKRMMVGALTVGATFRLPEVSFEEALANNGEKFFRIIAVRPRKKDYVVAISLRCTKRIELPPECLVVEHYAETYVSADPME